LEETLLPEFSGVGDFTEEVETLAGDGGGSRGQTAAAAVSAAAAATAKEQGLNKFKFPLRKPLY